MVAQGVLVEYFDLVFRASEESAALWASEIRQLLEAKFSDVLAHERDSADWKLRDNVNMHDLFVNLSQKNGIQWKEGTAERIREKGVNDSLADAFVSVEPTGTAALCFISLKAVTSD
jgi:hypothetical protein